MLIRDTSFICLRICGQVFGSIVDTFFYPTYTLRVRNLNIIWEPLLSFQISQIFFGRIRIHLMKKLRGVEFFTVREFKK